VRVLESGRISALALALALVPTGTALAAPSGGDEAVRRELAEMRAQMQQMAQRIDSLEGQLADARSRVDAADAAAQTAARSAADATALAAQARQEPVKVAWKGAPELSDGKGWSFKPRGRLQIDAAVTDAPKGVAGSENLGFSAEFRRAFFGFDGTMPGGIGYRFEADLANSDVQLTDVYFTYAPSRKVTLTFGHHKPFDSMEELTSDLFTSMMERAAFTTAFGFERRVGISATYQTGKLMAQGGVFTDDVASLNSDLDKSWSIDGRVVAMPKLAGGTLHLAASAHLRELGGAVASVRYRARPFVHTTDLRFVDTGTLSADAEQGLGLEAGWFAGRFHATSESFWQKVRRPGLADPTFNGGYAEVGYLLTDDQAAYKNGVIERVRPKAPLGAGGIGAVQVNARYDWLDLSDAGVSGGHQRTVGVSIIWIPTAYVRFIANYGHMWLDDAALTASGDHSYGVDAAGMRAQFDF